MRDFRGATARTGASGDGMVRLHDPIDGEADKGIRAGAGGDG